MNTLRDQWRAEDAAGLGLEWPGLLHSTRTTHLIHEAEAVWSQTNCYTDVWIGLLHGLGADVRPVLASAVAADCQEHQWEFYKPEHRDIEELYGIRVGEVDIWRGLERQVVEALQRGDTMSLEADAYWLPDTDGTSYQTTHSKTTIVPVAVNPARGYLEYLHNDGLFALDGEDYQHVVGDLRSEGIVPAPYTELIRLDGFRRGEGTLARGVSPHEESQRLLVFHGARRPTTNPMVRFSQAVYEAEQELIGLLERGTDQEQVQERFHAASFEITRQCGVAAQLAGYAVESVSPEAKEKFDEVSRTARMIQFKLGRAAFGRASKSEALLRQINQAWFQAQQLLTEALERLDGPSPKAH